MGICRRRRVGYAKYAHQVSDASQVQNRTSLVQRTNTAQTTTPTPTACCAPTAPSPTAPPASPAPPSASSAPAAASASLAWTLTTALLATYACMALIHLHRGIRMELISVLRGSIVIKEFLHQNSVLKENILSQRELIQQTNVIFVKLVIIVNMEVQNLKNALRVIIVQLDLNSLPIVRSQDIIQQLQAKIKQLAKLAEMVTIALQMALEIYFNMVILTSVLGVTSVLLELGDLSLVGLVLMQTIL